MIAALKAPASVEAPVAGEPDDRPVRLDAFYGGAFAVLQPKGWGYRSGLDALLLAAAVPAETSGRIADLGAGSGGVGLAAAVRAPASHVTLVEAEPVMAALCRRSLALAENAPLAPRLAVAHVDIADRRAAREAAGLTDGAFDLVLTNPPFHPANHRRPPDPVRERALFPAADIPLDRWLAVAAALLLPRGRLVTVLRADLLGEALAALQARLGALAILPVHTRAGAPAERIVVAARKGTRAPLRLLEGIALADGAGHPSDLADRVSAGTAELPQLFA